VVIGEDYPYPVVEYETAKEEFWRRYDRLKPAAAARLGEEAIARRASLTGGVPGAKRIAAEHGLDGADDGTDGVDSGGRQSDLSGFD
jgi:deoxyribodipyrimidine photo-lyase